MCRTCFINKEYSGDIFSQFTIKELSLLSITIAFCFFHNFQEVPADQCVFIHPEAG